MNKYNTESVQFRKYLKYFLEMDFRNYANSVFSGHEWLGLITSSYFQIY